MRTRYVAVSAVAVAVLGLAAGCNPGGSSASGGGGEHPAASGSPGAASSTGTGPDLQIALQRAYGKTTDAKTAKISATIKITGGSAAGTTTMSGAVQFDPPAEQVTVRTAGQQVEAIMVDGYEYIKTGSSWRKIDISSLTGGAPMDPTQALAYLQGVSSSVTKLGTSTVHGVRATGYRATVEVQKAAAKQGAKAQDALKNLSEHGVHSIPVEVWLDADGRVVREHSTLTMTGVGSGSMTVDSTTDLTGYGTPVHISAPAGA
ncbi:hypothetical protein Athai_25000 [Actinocatenispora thailandica]|uniref:LppX_LprAFG lipoprotein n=1 Tax=Actinocatenispora thailandica TaxID=227318 RepID=A0A7R7DP93_9ACTN|nr:hypothetical protein [Actinocatenispora thailandica]BCJ34997.1 hypothetical protein Athai_25000 [Actinocatenispora thailandica]